jgi:hypothetical protein
MLHIDETIDAFRRGSLNFDCKRMVLSQRKEGGERFEGQGYISQSPDGTLIFKIYVTLHNAEQLDHQLALLSDKRGKIYGEEMFYDLDVTARDGTHWAAARNLAAFDWDTSVVVNGELDSITADVEISSSQHYLRLHFFDEYDVPLHRMSDTERFGNRYRVLDLAEFEACGSNFEVRKREGSGDTVVVVTSEVAFPVAFDLRIQEALQYITANTAIWRARLESKSKHLELKSPWPKSTGTKLYPPISPGSMDFDEHGWRLFDKYLAYVVAKTENTYWNPVAYHLHNACEATANSLDARAVGSSVAVEALAGLIDVGDDMANPERMKQFHELICKWLAEQTDFKDLVPRVKKQIDVLREPDKRAKRTLLALADTGHVEKKYVKAWDYLRNRHVHPKLKDLKKPDQDLLDHIRRVEVLLRQLTFYLIGYEGPFTDYGAEGIPSKHYPLRAVPLEKPTSLLPLDS